MKKVPTHITPILLWQQADNVDTHHTEVGIVEVFEYDGENFCLFTEYDTICYETDYEDVLIDYIRYENEAAKDCPHCTGVGCQWCSNTGLRH